LINHCQDALNEAGQIATEELLKRFDMDGSPIKIGNSKLTSKGLFPKRYQTPHGEIEIGRHVYQSTKGGSIYCPLDINARIIHSVKWPPSTGQQPIIYMQCGPIRHTATTSENAPKELEVVPHYIDSIIDTPPDARIQDLFRHIAEDSNRTKAIVSNIVELYEQGRKVLVLTERTDHLKAIQDSLTPLVDNFFTLHGRISKKQRTAVIAELDALPGDAARILLATGKLVGEGFDHPPLDTLILAMPVSWKGTLQQYAGRLHREHTSKTDVKIIDFIDTGHPALLKMWDKRQRGYRVMGYRTAENGQPTEP